MKNVDAENELFKENLNDDGVIKLFSLKALKPQNRKSYIKIEEIRDDFDYFLEKTGLRTFETFLFSEKFKVVEDRMFMSFLENTFYLQITQKYLDLNGIDFKLDLILSTEKDEDRYMLAHYPFLSKDIKAKIDNCLQRDYYNFFKEYYTI